MTCELRARSPGASPPRLSPLVFVVYFRGWRYFFSLCIFCITPSGYPCVAVAAMDAVDHHDVTCHFALYKLIRSRVNPIFLGRRGSCQGTLRQWLTRLLCIQWTVSVLFFKMILCIFGSSGELGFFCPPNNDVSRCGRLHGIGVRASHPRRGCQQLSGVGVSWQFLSVIGMIMIVQPSVWGAPHTVSLISANMHSEHQRDTCIELASSIIRRNHHPSISVAGLLM